MGLCYYHVLTIRRRSITQISEGGLLQSNGVALCSSRVANGSPLPSLRPYSQLYSGIHSPFPIYFYIISIQFVGGKFALLVTFPGEETIVLHHICDGFNHSLTFPAQSVCDHNNNYMWVHLCKINDLECPQPKRKLSSHGNPSKVWVSFRL